MARVPLALTQAQLEQVMQMALPIPRDLRALFLQMVAQRLPAHPGDGEVFKVAAAAQKEVLWSVQRDPTQALAINQTGWCSGPHLRMSDILWVAIMRSEIRSPTTKALRPILLSHLPRGHGREPALITP